jgi:hypothetical protein
VLGCALGCALGCRGKPRTEHAQPASSTSIPSTSAVPADRLAPGEPAPGQEKVHELLLPRGAVVERRFGNSTYVHVPHSPEATANWVRGRAEDADGVVGPNGTVFAVVHVKDAPRTHHLRIEITGAGSESATMVIDFIDDAKPPPPSGLSNEELMKKAGLSPDGKFLDPQHTE